MKCAGVLHSIQARGATKPVVAIERHPQARLEVVTEVPFKGAYRALRLPVDVRRELIVREEFRVGAIEPHTAVCIQNPVLPAMRIADFRFEGPAVGAEIDEFRWIVLPRSRYEPDADTKNGLLLPFLEFGHVHCRAADQVDRESKSRGQEAGAIRKCLGVGNRTSEVANAVRQSSGEVCRAAKEAKGTGVVENGDMSPCSGARKRECPFEKKGSIKKGIGQSHRVGVNGRDQIGARSEILRLAKPCGEMEAKHNKDAK